MWDGAGWVALKESLFTGACSGHERQHSRTRLLPLLAESRACIPSNSCAEERWCFD